MTFFVVFNNIGWYDDFFIKSIRVVSEPMTIFFKFWTDFGDWLILFLITLAILIFNKEKKYGLLVFINLFSAGVINTVLKLIFTRERPGDMLIEQGGYAYPSGHSFVSIAFYGFLIYLLFKSNFDKWVKYIFTIVLAILILLIGISRIYLGVHYPSDVFSGFVGGLLYLIVFVEIIERREVLNSGKKKKRKKQKK